MLEGKCPKCGYHCFGWALRSPRNQTCPECGAGLEITEEGHKTITGYSPFTAEEHSVNLPTNIPPPHHQDEESHKHNK
jgi:uncharacterized OB-fold protein